MRFFLALFFAVIFVFIGVQAYRLYEQQGALRLKEGDLTAQATILAAENRKFAGDIEYLRDDKNLTKELQSKFNYRKPDEKLYMLVPGQ